MKALSKEEKKGNCSKLNNGLRKKEKAKKIMSQGMVFKNVKIQFGATRLKKHRPTFSFYYFLSSLLNEALTLQFFYRQIIYVHKEKNTFTVSNNAFIASFGNVYLNHIFSLNVP